MQLAGLLEPLPVLGRSDGPVLGQAGPVLGRSDGRVLDRSDGPVLARAPSDGPVLGRSDGLSHGVPCVALDQAVSEGDSERIHDPGAYANLIGRASYAQSKTTGPSAKP